MNEFGFEPMLAGKVVLSQLQYPVLASPKLDGIRALNHGRVVLSRKLKPLPNVHLQRLLGVPGLAGFDSELIVGEPWGKTVYRDTVSVVMSDDKPVDGLRMYALDLYDSPHDFRKRWHELQRLADKVTALPVDVVEQVVIENEKALLKFEAAVLERGFEGVMVRHPEGRYKFGRSTTREGLLLKRKLFEDSEAYVIGIEEEMFNGNEAKKNELGRTKRSTAKTGLIGKGTMGALICRDVKTGVEFNIGTGFTADERASWWEWWQTDGCNRKRGWPIVKYKFFPVGVKEKPRHPVFLGMRDARDM